MPAWETGAAFVVPAARAQQEIRIGVIYPLTGAAASTGAEMKNALEFAADIINNGSKETPDLPFAAGGGLPNLKGAKIKLVFADHLDLRIGLLIRLLEPVGLVETGILDIALAEGNSLDADHTQLHGILIVVTNGGQAARPPQVYRVRVVLDVEVIKE